LSVAVAKLAFGSAVLPIPKQDYNAYDGAVRDDETTVGCD
jgi:hypothetical protein